jgi:hypothetical protein
LHSELGPSEDTTAAIASLVQYRQYAPLTPEQSLEAIRAMSRGVIMDSPGVTEGNKIKLQAAKDVRFRLDANGESIDVSSLEAIQTAAADWYRLHLPGHRPPDLQLSGAEAPFPPMLALGNWQASAAAMTLALWPGWPHAYILSPWPNQIDDWVHRGYTWNPIVNTAIVSAFTCRRDVDMSVRLVLPCDQSALRFARLLNLSEWRYLGHIDIPLCENTAVSRQAPSQPCQRQVDQASCCRLFIFQESADLRLMNARQCLIDWGDVIERKSWFGMEISQIIFDVTANRDLQVYAVLTAGSRVLMVGKKRPLAEAAYIDGKSVRDCG